MDSWKKTLVLLTAPMEEAVARLQSEEFRIVLVVDKKRKLLGTITDGDIRRALLKHYGMDIAVSHIMHNDPCCINSKSTKAEICLLMQREGLQQMPIVDSIGRVIGLELLRGLHEKSKLHSNPVFLLAGGFGKRLRPLTDETPKPLLKVGGKPILENILDSFVRSGYYDFYISTHYKSEMIRDYFGDGDKWGVSIKYVHEDEPLGTAGSLGLLPKNLSNLPMIMMNGDLLTTVNYDQLLKYHKKYSDIATMCVSKYDFQVPFGVVQAVDQCITSIEEKPVHKFFVNAGIYVVSEKLRKSVVGRGYIDMPDLLQEQITKKKKIAIFPIHEYWLDIGRMDDYKKAQDEIISK